MESLGRTIIFLLKGHGMFFFFFFRFQLRDFVLCPAVGFVTEGKSPGSLCSPAF